MGLSVVQGIVKSHKGMITVYSELNKGSVFHVYLPKIDARAEPETLYPDSPSGGHESILFVDDEEALSYLGKEVLESLGYDVISVTDSTEALGLFCSQPDRFDLVITDQTMPHMTGTMLAQKILEIRPNIPILLCTGYSEVVSKEKADELGIRAYLQKPLLIRELAHAIRKALKES